jgi:signal transduction histidine kinase
VIFALGALVVIPIVMNGRISAVRKEIIAVAEPARGLSAGLQIALTREMTALRNMQLGRNGGTRADYDRLVGEHERLLRFLDPPSAQLGAPVAAALAHVRQRAARWHAHVDSTLARAAARAGPPGSAPALDPILHDEAVEAAVLLEQAIADATQQRFYRINTAELLETRLTLAAVLLALVAALVTAWLGRRLRLVAEEAARRREEVERLLDAKARLMNGITHDLKNPLNVIDGYAQLLARGLKGDVTAAQKESIARIRNGVRSSLAIINDLLEIARAESGELRLDRAPADVVELAREMVEDHRGEIEMAQLALTFHTEVAQAVESIDADRVLGILSNLLSNARKYTPPGGHVEVRVAAAARGPRATAGPRLVLAVRDDGPGIPPDRREFIFEEFARLETGTRGGAGLGLAISRAIARLMGGDLTVDSTPGQGSTFTLWLPASRAHGERAVAHDAAAAGDGVEPADAQGVVHGVARRPADPPGEA